MEKKIENSVSFATHSRKWNELTIAFKYIDVHLFVPLKACITIVRKENPDENLKSGDFLSLLTIISYHNRKSKLNFKLGKFESFRIEWSADSVGPR